MTSKRSNVISMRTKYVSDENKRIKRAAKASKTARYRTLLIFVICIVSLLYVFSKKRYQEEVYDEKVEMNEQLEAEVAELKEIEAELEQSIENLEDPEHLAKIAREEYYLSGEGEIIFVVPEEAETESAPSEDTGDQEDESSNKSS